MCFQRDDYEGGLVQETCVTIATIARARESEGESERERERERE